MKKLMKTKTQMWGIHPGDECPDPKCSGLIFTDKKIMLNICYVFSVREPRPPFISCRECSGMKQDCPHQSIRNHTCFVPRVLGIVHPSGFMEFKVNATSEIGVTTSDNLTCELYNHSKTIR